jgi:OOP family OmpA-OmpF porin
MSYNFKRTIFLAAALLLSATAFAQDADTTATAPKFDYIQPFSPVGAYRTWSIGFNTGIMTTYNVFTTNDKLDFTVPNIQYGYGGYIKKQIVPAFGIQADILVGKLVGDDAQPNPTTGKSPYSSFSTTVNYAADITGNFTVGNISWRSLKTTIQPFLTIGAGTMNYKPTITTTAGLVENYKPGSDVIDEIYTPLGVGIKFNVAKGVNVELAYQVNFVYNDNVDGYKWGNTNDKYSYGHVGLEFAIGKRTKPQLAVHNPVASMRQEYLNGIGHLNTQLSGMQVQVDSEKARNQALQQQVAASNAVIARLTTDSDGDGVPDFFDKCQNTPLGTKVDGSGCPLPVPKPENVFVTEEDKLVVNEAIRNLEFESGRAVISERSYPSLEKLAKVLTDKKFHLKLAGYTDATGSAAINLALSKDRAEAIKMFLVSRGADPMLIQTEGYGKAHPIASNKTKQGRALNRRVEFSLY